MLVRTPTPFICWNPTPSMWWCLEMGPRGEIWVLVSHEDGAPLMGLVFLQREEETRALSLCLMRTQGKGTHSGGHSHRNWVIRCLDLGRSSFQNREINICSLSRPISGVSSWQPKQTKTERCNENRETYHLSGLWVKDWSWKSGGKYDLISYGNDPRKQIVLLVVTLMVDSLLYYISYY